MLRVQWLSSFSRHRIFRKSSKIAVLMYGNNFSLWKLVKIKLLKQNTYVLAETIFTLQVVI
jgi:hypothetical protein